MSWAASPGLRVTRWKAWRRGSPTLWGVRRIGISFGGAEAVSYVRSDGEGPVMTWFLEDYRTMSFSRCGSGPSGCLIPLADRTGTGTVTGPWRDSGVTPGATAVRLN